MRANRLVGAMLQPSASPRLIEYFTACSFTTGRLPGSPRSTGVICVFGAPSWLLLLAGLGASLNIFVRVFSSTCTSNPSTGSYFAIASS